LREAKRCFAREDYEAAMRTGVVIRKLRSIGAGKNAKIVPEYEINTGLIEAFNSIEKRAAIETGQEVDRSDINLRGGLAAQAEMLRRAFTLEELEAMDAKLEAAKKAPKLIEAPAAEPCVKEQERPTPSSSESSFGRAKLGPSETGLDVSANGHANGKESWR
jgi:hypothetical protein